MSPFFFVGLELRGDVLGKSGGGGLAGSCGPVQKAVTGTRPELPGGDQFPQQRAGVRVVVEARDHRVVDGQGEVQPDVVGVFQRPQGGQSQPNGVAYHEIYRLRVADTLGDQRDRLAPQRVLQPVADETRHVAPDPHRQLADLGQQRHDAIRRIWGGARAGHHLDHRDKIRRVPKVCPDHSAAVLDPFGDSADRQHRGVGGQHRVGRECRQPFEEFLLDGQVFDDGLNHQVGVWYRRG